MFKKHEQEIKRTEKTGLNQAWKMLQKAEKENFFKEKTLEKKLIDQKQELIKEERKKKYLLLKRLNMIEKTIRKTQEKAATQAQILNHRNSSRTGFKNQIKTQKMYFDLFNGIIGKKKSAKKVVKVKGNAEIVANYVKFQLYSKMSDKGTQIILVYFSISEVKCKTYFD